MAPLCVCCSLHAADACTCDQHIGGHRTKNPTATSRLYTHCNRIGPIPIARAAKRSNANTRKYTNPQLPTATRDQRTLNSLSNTTRFLNTEYTQVHKYHM